MLFMPGPAPAPGTIEPRVGSTPGLLASRAYLPGSAIGVNACFGMLAVAYCPAGGSMSCSAVVSGFKFGCRVRQPEDSASKATKSTQIPHFAVMGSFPFSNRHPFQDAEI